MTIDRTTKTLLLAIAAGLWLHLAGDFIRSTPVHAQNILGSDELRELRSIGSDLAQIKGSVSAIRGSFDSWQAVEAARRR